MRSTDRSSGFVPTETGQGVLRAFVPALSKLSDQLMTFHQQDHPEPFVYNITRPYLNGNATRLDFDPGFGRSQESR